MEFAWPFLIPITAILAGCGVAIAKTIARARVRELEIRERIAMIERGLMPPPEVDPNGFDRAMKRVQGPNGPSPRSAARHRRVGVTLMGIGFGLLVLISFAAGEPQIALGVGGFMVVLGIAFFINSLFEDAPKPQWNPPATPLPAPPPPSTSAPDQL